ncbi:MAG: bifunctional oligoribonuclease/PAP phosphatase NrnA [Deltaproteobacteria bacterium]|nr:bifunctional oligoribonuclease/PAP phosphatase NrnA [Deltaproteobacteria bacterium]
MKDFAPIIHGLGQGQSFLIGSHYSPDGDAIGSMLALGNVLEKMGKQVLLFNRDKLPLNLAFLEKNQLVVNKIKSNLQFDTVVMLDCAQASRVGGDFEQAFKKVSKSLCIDHHILDKTDAQISLVFPEAASTGVILAELFERMKVPLDPTLAQYLYCTLVVDTGFFRYSNATSEVFQLASRLVSAGAIPEQVSAGLEESFPIERYRLLKLCLDTLEVKPDIRYASMELTQAMLTQAKAWPDLAEEFTMFPRSIGGVTISAVFREVNKNKVKVSLRSKEGVDISAVARSFGGGGHVYAAGCTIDAPMADVKAKIEAAVRKLMGK